MCFAGALHERHVPTEDDPFGWVGATVDGKYRVDEVVGHGGFGIVYRPTTWDSRRKSRSSA